MTQRQNSTQVAYAACMVSSPPVVKLAMWGMRLACIWLAEAICVTVFTNKEAREVLTI